MTAPATTAELQKHFPNYKLETFLAQGGMGAVYKAIDLRTQKPVAIKILSDDLAKNKEFLQRFRQEAEVMSKLRHSNLVSFHEFKEVKSKRYIVMEYIDGRSLHYSAHGSAIDPEVAFDIVLGVCRGVKHAHDRGVLHRDIKPDNIFLTPDAVPKLGDFGLSRPRSYDETNQVIYATEGYSAPEVSSSPKLVDERADIYSIGVIFYEMICGELPDPNDYIHPCGLFPELDMWYNIVIQRCIESDPELRYPNMKALFADLARIKTPMYRYLLSTPEQIQEVEQREGKVMGEVELTQFNKKKKSFWSR